MSGMWPVLKTKLGCLVQRNFTHTQTALCLANYRVNSWKEFRFFQKISYYDQGDAHVGVDGV